MVRFRQKEYSGKTKKIVRGVLKAKDRVITKIDNAGLKAGEAIGYGKNTPGNFKFKPKSNRAINRDAVEMTNKAENTAVQVLTTPVGHGVDKGMSALAGNPISTVGNAVGKGIMFVPAVPTVAKTLPIGGASMGIEKALKTKVPGYDRFTRKIKGKYDRSKMSEGLRGKYEGASLLDITRMIPIG